jgi:hypothetical protein
MWGIRAIRAGFFLGGLLVTVAGSGCCESCQNLWKGDTKPPVGTSEPTEQGEPTLGSWNRGADSVPGSPKQSSHITPERIHGGIY